MGALSRRKGASYECEVARDLTEAFGVTCKRGFQPRGARCDSVPDVECPVFWPECKRGKKPNPRAALAQAIADTDGRVPVAIIRDDREEAFVCMRYADWLELAKLRVRGGDA